MYFQKWQGTGNDFIFIHDPEATFNLSAKEIAMLCHRRFGIGADGLIAWQIKDGLPFMKYYNSDGNESTMCGNGGRCFAAFSVKNGLVDSLQFSFLAVDGIHNVEVLVTEEDFYQVKLQMIDVKQVESFNNDFVLNTGSPHYVKLVNEEFLNQDSIVVDAHTIRYNPPFDKEGINVNFVELMDTGHIYMRTYERGVEDETYSCGTGVTAAALATYKLHAKNHVFIRTNGGNLEVKFTPNQDGSFSDVWLIGPATLVFEGELQLAH